MRRKEPVVLLLLALLLFIPADTGVVVEVGGNIHFFDKAEKSLIEFIDALIGDDSIPIDKVKDSGIFSKEEKEKLTLIPKVQASEREVGFEPTRNWKNFKEKAGYDCNILYFQDPDEIATSYCDPKIMEMRCPFDNMASNAVWLKNEKGIDIEKYDYHFYVTDGLAGEAEVTREVLRRGFYSYIGLIWHEDTHININNLPRDLNESLAFFMGVVGPDFFFKSKREKIIADLDFYEKGRMEIINCQKKLLALNNRFKKGVITRAVYQKKKSEILERYDFESASDVASDYTYARFWPLLRKLYEKCGYDLKKFVRIVKKIPFREPKKKYQSEEYFRETLIEEEKAEVYLKKLIKNIKR